MELRLGRLPEDYEYHSVNYTNPTRQSLVRSGPTALILAKSVISFMTKFDYRDISIVYPQLNKVSAGAVLQGSESFHAAPVEKHRQYDCFEYVDALEEQLIGGDQVGKYCDDEVNRKRAREKWGKKGDFTKKWNYGSSEFLFDSDEEETDDLCNFSSYIHPWTYGTLENGVFFWNEERIDEILASGKQESRLFFHCLDPLAIGKGKYKLNCFLLHTSHAN